MLVSSSMKLKLSMAHWAQARTDRTWAQLVFTGVHVNVGHSKVDLVVAFVPQCEHSMYGDNGVRERKSFGSLDLELCLVLHLSNWEHSQQRWHFFIRLVCFFSIWNWSFVWNAALCGSTTTGNCEAVSYCQSVPIWFLSHICFYIAPWLNGILNLETGITFHNFDSLAEQLSFRLSLRF